MTFYPSRAFNQASDDDRRASTSFVCKGQDPDRPGDLVLQLQSTLAGCEWMLNQWEKLRAILECGQAWVSVDKLRAVRLLGKQPIDANDDHDVAMVFLASFVLKPERETWYGEIAVELAGKDMKRFLNHASARELESRMPKDAAGARQALGAIIDRATGRLTQKAQAHRERAELMAELTPDILAFDDSMEGERLRRYELASSRGMTRSLSELRKHRSLSVVRGQLSVVSGPLSVVSCRRKSSSAPRRTRSQP